MLRKPALRTQFAPAKALPGQRDPLRAVHQRFDKIEARLMALEQARDTLAPVQTVAPAFRAKHMGFGHFTVVDRNGGEVDVRGVKMNKAAASWLAEELSKPDASLMLEEQFRTLLDQARRMSEEAA